MKRVLNILKGNGKILFLILLVICILSLIILNNSFFKRKSLNNNTIENTELLKIKETHKQYNKQIDLYFNDLIIPYSYTDNFYLLNITKIKDYKKIYTKSDYKIAQISKKNEYEIDLILYNDEYYKEVTLMLTNIPVISINSDNSLYLYGFDNSVNNLSGELSLRGDSSQYSDKKSYKLKLFDKNNSKVSLSLLGMHQSSSWILNPIFFDNSYMREKLSYDIWNNLSNNYKHTLEYIELLINGEYQGLYYLQENVTMDLFDGDIDNDLFVSIKKWKTDIEEDDTQINNGIFNEFEIEEGLNGDYNTQVEVLKNFDLSINDEKGKIDIKYDFDNIVNYGLLLNFTMARDNTYKNQKILFKKINDYYLVEKTVWDLDWTFSNENINLYYNDLNTSIDDVDFDLAVPKSLKENELFKKVSKEKYFEFRKSFYNYENMESLIDKYSSYLEKYGAVLRDINKWENDKYAESINVIKDFIRKRIKVLDKYFGGL